MAVCHQLPPSEIGADVGRQTDRIHPAADSFRSRTCTRMCSHSMCPVSTVFIDFYHLVEQHEPIMADQLETQVTLSYMHQIMYEMFLSMDHTILSFMDFANWMILCFGFTCSDAMKCDAQGLQMNKIRNLISGYSGGDTLWNQSETVIQQLRFKCWILHICMCI